jgi:FAD/FMN-containing dehydrogenase
VAGYLLGGGLSWFSRTYGFASSSVRAVELVTSDGEQVRVTAESDPELFWALRGAGGEFGIVTAIEIALFPHSSFVGGQLLFSADSARDVFAAFADLTADAPDALSVIASVLHYPPLPFIPEPVRGKSVAALTMAYLGAENDLAKLIGPARAAGPLIDDRISTLTIGRLGEVAAEPTEPAPFIDFATLARRFDHGTAGRLLDVVGDRETTPLLAASVRHLGGTLTTAPDQSGLAATIDHPYVLSAIGIAPDPAAIPALEAASAAVLPALGEDGVDQAPFTFLGERPITDAYATADITRLRALKQARDPRNVIRSNHPVL